MNRNSVIGAFAALAVANGCAQQEEEPVFVDPEPRAVGTTGLERYCDRNPGVCVVGGALIVGGLVSTLDGGGSSGSFPMKKYPTTTIVSDGALKRDIRALFKLDNGLTVYSFRYAGDDQTFSGFLAEDLAADPKFARAVLKGPDGFLRIDYGLLGLDVVNGQVMAAAGQAAADRAAAQ